MGLDKAIGTTGTGTSDDTPTPAPPRSPADPEERRRSLRAVILIVLLALALCFLSYYVLHLRTSRLANTQGPDFKVSTLLNETGEDAIESLTGAGFTYVKDDDADGFFYLPLGLSDKDQLSEWLRALAANTLSDEDREMLESVGIIECYDIEGNMLSENDLKEGAQIHEATISYFGLQELSEGIGDNAASRTLLYGIADTMGVTIPPSTLSYRDGVVAAYNDLSMDDAGNDVSWYLTISTLDDEDPLFYEVSFGVSELSSW